MQFIGKERATTAIYVRIKRKEETYFLLCDEYELVETLKSRVLLLLKELKFSLPRQEEELTTEDIRLNLEIKRFWDQRFNFEIERF